MDAGRSCVGFAPRVTWTPKQFIVYMAFWVVMLLPVPLARVILYDHSTSQIVAGSGLGALLAPLWFAAWEKGLILCRLRLGGRVCGGCLLHDYVSAMEAAGCAESGRQRSVELP